GRVNCFFALLQSLQHRFPGELGKYEQQQQKDHDGPDRDVEPALEDVEATFGLFGSLACGMLPACRRISPSRGGRGQEGKRHDCDQQTSMHDDLASARPSDLRSLPRHCATFQTQWRTPPSDRTYSLSCACAVSGGVVRHGAARVGRSPTHENSLAVAQTTYYL